MNILVLNGPNLNLLGIREPQTYGSLSMETIEQRLRERARVLGVSVDFFQSNHEGELIDRVHRSFQESDDGIVCNPGGYTHTSIALRDAFLATALPFVEVHLSNVYARESFRHRSYFSDVAIGQISGFGAQVYDLGFDALYQFLKTA